MKVRSRELCISRKKNLAKKGDRRRFKRVPTRRKSTLSPNPTPNYIPLELQIETLLRLPVKSLLRFQNVSKLWSSINTSQDFRNRHLNLAASSAPSRLLISFGNLNGKGLLFVSLPYPNVSSSSFTSCSVPYRDMSILKLQGKNVYNATQGLICVRSKLNMEIFNRSTRRVHVLPRIKFKYHRFLRSSDKHSNYFVGYDPVGDQYKVLAVDKFRRRLEHKVLVLGGEERAWGEAPCVACPHVARTRALYMNGTLYYGAIIVCFVRFETYKIINIPVVYNNMLYTFKTLINYEGKVSTVENPNSEGSFRMWVVEDGEKEDWSMNTFHLELPQSIAGIGFNVTNTFSTGEICFISKLLADPFCLLYYNLETNITRSVRIEGLNQELYGPQLRQADGYSVIVSDHFESFMFS